MFILATVISKEIQGIFPQFKGIIVNGNGGSQYISIYVSIGIGILVYCILAHW